jgi:two-component system chemotaxis response regulator CheB
MPLSATQIAGADRVVPLSELADLLVALVRAPDALDRGAGVVDPIERMPGIAESDMERQIRDECRGDVSVFTCPECGGSLWQVDETGPIRFRCHVGHAYNGDVLLSEQTDALEAALWTAVRTFREKSVLARQLATRERAKGDDATAERFDEQAGQADRYSSLILRYVLDVDPQGNGGTPISPVPEARI